MNYLKSFIFSPKPGDEEAGKDEEPPVTRGAYQIDFDKFDDPNFNPFETKAKVNDAFNTSAPESTPPINATGGNILLDNVMKGKIIIKLSWS